jgi:dTDP-4-dehydrorhamnose 3,5-epimerase-like enzyme
VNAMIEGVVVKELKTHSDERGFFGRTTIRKLILIG